MKNFSLTFWALLSVCVTLQSFSQSVTIDPKNGTAAIVEANSIFKGFLPPRMSEVQRNNNITNPVAGTIVYCTDCATGSGPYYYNGVVWYPMFTSPPPTPTYTVGQSAFGGIIFFVEPSGQHGLVAATADVAAGAVAWFNGNFTNTQAVRPGVYGGGFNTDAINLNQGTGSYAALVAAQHNGGSYGDWYLPSSGELQLLYAQRATVGGFSNTNYWSSTEISAATDQPTTNAYMVNFGISNALISTLKSITGRVRPIRRF
jgi:hypothetical protein